MENPPLTDQLANVSPTVVVSIILGFTLLRLLLAKNKEPWARTISETCDTINFVLALAFLLIRPFVGQAFYIPSESMEYTLLKRDRLIVDKFSYRYQEPQRRDVVVFEAPPEATDGVAGIDYIKRLIALPGETIEVRKARMLIDGERVPSDDTPLHHYLRQSLRLSEEESIKVFSDHLLIAGKETLSLADLTQKLGQPGARIELHPGQTLINGKPLDEPYTREDPGYDDGPRTIKPGHLFMLGDNRNHSRDSHFWGELERRRVVGHARFVFWPPPRIGVIR